MSWAFKTAGASKSGYNVALTPALPSGIVAGDTLFLMMACHQGTFSVPTVSGWTLISPNVNAQQVAVFERVATGSDSAPTFTFGTDYAWGQIFCYSGGPGTVLTPHASADIKNNSITSVSIPALTITATNCLVLFVAARNHTTTVNSATWNTLAGFTLRSGVVVAGNAIACVVDEQIQTSATNIASGNQSLTISETVTQQHEGIVLALLPNQNAFGTVTTAESESAGAGGALIITGSNTTAQASETDAASASSVFYVRATVTTAQGEMITAAGTAPAPPQGTYAITGGMPDGADTATLTFRATYGSIIIDKTIYVSKAKTGVSGSPGPVGTSAVVMKVTRPSFMVFTYAEGTPVDPTFAGVEGYLTVVLGITDITAACTLSAVAVGCAGVINTANNIPVAAHTMGYYNITAMSADTATLTLNAFYQGGNYSIIVNLTKEKGGYEIVNSLPTTNLFDGRMVYLTTDHKLYRYDISIPSWTTAVPALDITGTLADAQIASLAASKVTGQMTDAQLASISIAKLTGTTVAANILTAGSIVSGDIAAGAIGTAQLVAGAVQAGKIAAGTIQAADIAANAITGNKIAANTILAGNIASNTLTANEMSAGVIITASAQINDGVIITAKIGNLAVNSANIADLTVGTNKITGNAVSSQGSVRVGVSGALTAGTTSTAYWNNVCTASIAHDGSSNIAVSGFIASGNVTTNYNYNCRLTYYNGVTFLGSTSFSNYWAPGGYAWFSAPATMSFPISDTFTSTIVGTITVNLEMWTANANTTVQNAGLLLLENKK